MEGALKGFRRSEFEVKDSSSSTQYDFRGKFNFAVEPTVQRQTNSSAGASVVMERKKNNGYKEQI